MECPICHKTYGLYKEILDNGKDIICCLATTKDGICNYKSKPMERHKVDALGLRKKSEIKGEL